MITFNKLLELLRDTNVAYIEHESCENGVKIHFYSYDKCPLFVNVSNHMALGVTDACVRRFVLLDDGEFQKLDDFLNLGNRTGVALHYVGDKL